MTDQAAQATHQEPAKQLDPKLLEFLICPVSKSPLSYDKDNNELISKTAGLAYPIRDGIPIMLAEEARKLEESELGN